MPVLRTAFIREKTETGENITLEDVFHHNQTFTLGVLLLQVPHSAICLRVFSCFGWRIKKV